MPDIVDDYVPYGIQEPQPSAPAPETPSTMETLGAAGTIVNWPYRAWRYLANRDDVVTDPAHNPFDMIKGTKYEADPGRFAYSRNADETRAIMAEWDQDEQAQDVLSRSGRFGTVAMVGMGLLDPTIFLPVAKVFTGAAAGYRALRICGDVAPPTPAGAAIGEGAMAATTPHYSGQDAAIGIGTATLLGGLLGTGAGALISAGERKAVESALHADRVEWGADVAASSTRPAGVPGPAAAGAAAADARELNLRSIPGLSKLPDPTGKLSPPRRVLNSPFQAARRATVDLVETPYIFDENVKGVATTQGPALDRLARNEVNRARVGMMRQFEDAYARYRFGGAPETWRQSLARKGAMLMDSAGRPSQHVSSADFRSLIDEALRNGDSHAIPEVAETAKWMRNNIIVPWRDRAIGAGLLPEGVEAATADSYMMRVWNKQKLVGERPQAVKIFADWLQGEEAKKADLQDTMRDLTGQMEANAAKAERLQANRTKKLGADNEKNAAAIAVLENQNATLRQRLEEALTQWQGKSSRAAKKAMAGRDDLGPRVDGEARSSADGEVNAAVRRILEKERLRDRKELESLADEIVDRITGSPDGRLPYDAYTGSEPSGAGRSSDARGPLAAREFMIPDALVRDFIDTDALNTAEMYLNTMVPDILLTERFGDVGMTETFRRVAEEAAAMENAATTPAERQKIHARRDAVLADVAAMRDRIRHTYGFSSDPRQRFLGRMASTAGRFDVMTNLGGAALSSLPDMAGIQWRYGLMSTFRNAWAPFFKALVNPETRKAIAAHKQQLQGLGLAAETYLATRAHGLHDVLDVYRPTSRFERGIKLGSDKFQAVSFLSHWTDFGKLAAGMVSSTELSRAAEALSAGKASARQIRDLAENGIDAAMASRIDRALNASGGSNVVDGMRIPNTGNWSDRGARDAFEGALARDVDIMIISPGAEKPLMMSNPIVGLILQYKTFVAASTERLLIRSLQARDAQVLQGMVSAIGLGVLAEYAYSSIVGRDMKLNAGDMIKAGVSRSGMLGWYQEANALSEKWWNLDAFGLVGAKRPDSRYVSRETLTAALGPTAGKVESLIRVGKDAAQLDWNAGDTRRLRRMVVGQNLFYIRGLLDRLEAGANEAVGIEPLPDGNH